MHESFNENSVKKKHKYNVLLESSSTTTKISGRSLLLYDFCVPKGSKDVTSGGKQGVHTWVRETVSPDNLGEKSVKSWRLRGAVVALTWRYRGAYVALLWRCLGAIAALSGTVLAWLGQILWEGPNRGANVAWSWR